MLDLKGDVYTALSAVGTTYYIAPDDFVTLPLITYFELSNISTAEADDEEYESKIVFAVDLYGDNISTLSTLALSVNTAMVGLGYKRTASIDLFETDTALYHKHFKFTIRANN